MLLLTNNFKLILLENSSFSSPRVRVNAFFMCGFVFSSYDWLRLQPASFAFIKSSNVHATEFRRNIRVYHSVCLLLLSKSLRYAHICGLFFVRVTLASNLSSVFQVFHSSSYPGDNISISFNLFLLVWFDLIRLRLCSCFRVFASSISKSFFLILVYAVPRSVHRE